MTYKELKDELQRGVELVNELDAKWTKANSKRLRALLNELKKSTTAIKQELMDTDKAQ